MRRVAYFTDVEGRWEKLAGFVERTAGLALRDDHIAVDDHTLLVFGGDAIDRGPAGRRVVSVLLASKMHAPDRVVLLAGNRDINKMRLVRELNGYPPANAPDQIVAAGRGALLTYIFARTMGAADAFEHRRAELARLARSCTNEDVAESFLHDLEPNGELTRYLAACQLAHREGNTLFLHGAVTEESYGRCPTIDERASNVDDWIDRLNGFYSDQIEQFRARRLKSSGAPGWEPIVAYQAPIRGTRTNQSSVVYGRPVSESGEIALPTEEVVEWLRASDVRRVVLGHTPTGDCPTLLRDNGGFELLMADNSYGRIESGASVVIHGENSVEVHGETLLDDGEEAIVEYSLRSGEPGPLGFRDASTKRLVKAKLRSGDADEASYLLFRPLAGYEVEQTRARETELVGRVLETPR